MIDRETFDVLYYLAIHELKTCGDLGNAFLYILSLVPQAANSQHYTAIKHWAGNLIYDDDKLTDDLPGMLFGMYFKAFSLLSEEIYAH